ncbi:MAG: hypothetical protein A2X84_11875 [Desulfuromonadaceae bacterium GWC2_58_13]|nr:MAG: hypothetical protein A2X84_11875 [Desulfuromonadaceae bacterium GWC2_58_13]
MGFRRKLSLILLVGVLFFAPGSESAMEHHFIYFPDRSLVATPALFELTYEEVSFAAVDGTRLHGWYLPGEPDRPLILFCHGNAGNISHRLDNLRQLRRLGVSVFIFDYRGYGNSDGKASEAGTYSDARGALAWLKNRGWSQQKIIYFGRSLGAAIAVQLALEHPPAGLILETPFTSIAAMGRHHNPILYLALGWLLDARYDNLAKIAQIRVPLVIFQGDRDSIVPPAMARQLFDTANEPKIWHLIPGADHNNTYEAGGEAYWTAWSEFLSQCSR